MGLSEQNGSKSSSADRSAKSSSVDRSAKSSGADRLGSSKSSGADRPGSSKSSGAERLGSKSVKPATKSAAPAPAPVASAPVVAPADAIPPAGAKLLSRLKGVNRKRSKLVGASVGLFALAVAGSFILLSSTSTEHGYAKVAGHVAPASSVAAKNGPRGAAIKGKGSSRSNALALHAPGSSKAADEAAAQLAAGGDAAVCDFGANGALKSSSKRRSKANGQDSSGSSGDDASKLAKGERRMATPEEIARIRSMLLSPDPKDRLAALRLARTLDAPELGLDVRSMLANETNTPVKRVGVQVLALDDPSASTDTFQQMRNDPDAVVRVNSAFGMARNGDDAQAAWLLKVYDASRVVAPRLVPVLGAALEDPTIKSPAVVARFQQIAADPKRSPDLRARAAAIVTAKQGG